MDKFSALHATKAFGVNENLQNFIPVALLISKKYKLPVAINATLYSVEIVSDESQAGILMR